MTKKITAFATISPTVTTGTHDIPRSKSILRDSASFTGIQHDTQRERNATVEHAFAIGSQVQHVTIEKRELAVESADHFLSAKENEVRTQEEKDRNACSSEQRQDNRILLTQNSAFTFVLFTCQRRRM